MTDRMTPEEYRLALKLFFKDSHVEAARLLGFSRQMSYYYYDGTSPVPNSVRNLIYLIDSVGVERAKEVLVKKEEEVAN